MVSSIRTSRARLSRVAATKMMNEQRDALGLRRVCIEDVEAMSVQAMLEELNRLALLNADRKSRIDERGLWAEVG